MFYSTDNIVQYIKSYLHKFEETITKKELSNLFEKCKKIFLIDDVSLKNIYDNNIS